MKVYELMNLLAGMNAGEEVCISGEYPGSGCLELMTVTTACGEFGVTLWANGLTTEKEVGNQSHES